MAASVEFIRLQAAKSEPEIKDGFIFVKSCRPRSIYDRYSSSGNPIRICRLSNKRAKLAGLCSARSLPAQSSKWCGKLLALPRVRIDWPQLNWSRYRECDSRKGRSDVTLQLPPSNRTNWQLRRNFVLLSRMHTITNI